VEPVAGAGVDEGVAGRGDPPQPGALGARPEAPRVVLVERDDEAVGERGVRTPRRAGAAFPDEQPVPRAHPEPAPPVLQERAGDLRAPEHLLERDAADRPLVQAVHGTGRAVDGAVARFQEAVPRLLWAGGGGERGDDGAALHDRAPVEGAHPQPAAAVL
jgi:hypothetical protein